MLDGQGAWRIFTSKRQVIERHVLKRVAFLTLMTQNWAQKLSPYRVADDRRAIFEIAITAVAFIASWVFTYKLSLINPWLAFASTILTAGFMVRFFMLQHDCGHLSMFTSKAMNDWVGRAIGVITLTPYDYWRHAHALHHAGSGNLDRRGIGDIDTLTLAEYSNLGFWGRAGYRLYRNPLVLFVIGPIYVFVLRHRFPPESFSQGRAAWLSVMATNLGIVLLSAGLIYFVGLWAFLLVHVPAIVLGASIGVWLFYVQHQFDPTHWEHHENWDAQEAALEGSSFYDLPKPLMWMTGNIGIHHLHHLSSRIPFYRLPQVLKDYPELNDVSRLTFWDSLRCINLALWDERAKELISFRRAHRTMRLQAKVA